MKIGFTGTRKGMTEKQMIAFALLMMELDLTEFHHGDAEGADKQACKIIRDRPTLKEMHAHPAGSTGGLGGMIERYVLRDSHRNMFVLYNARPPLTRNHDIVDCTELLIACPKSMKEELRSGTWATVRYARKLERPVIIIYPNGISSSEGNHHVEQG